MTWSLVIDTSHSSALYGITFRDTVVCELCTYMNFEHTKTILDYIHFFSQQYKISLDQYHHLIIGSGPGSFTGLRVSYATMKMISVALNIPIIAISSLYALALSAYHFQPEKKYIISIRMAQSNCIFAGVYQSDTTHKLTPLADEASFEINDFVYFISHIPFSASEVLIVGDYHPIIENITLKNITFSPIKIPSTAEYYTLAQTKMRSMGRQELLREGQSILPQYLQKTQAEKNLLKTKLIYNTNNNE